MATSKVHDKHWVQSGGSCHFFLQDWRGRTPDCSLLIKNKYKNNNNQEFPPLLVLQVDDDTRQTVVLGFKNNNTIINSFDFLFSQSCRIDEVARETVVYD